MSDPRAKAERSRAKDLRQGITEQRPHIPGKKKGTPRPWKVMCESRLFGRVFCFGRHATKEAAQKWIEKQSRSYGGATALGRYYIEENKERTLGKL